MIDQDRQRIRERLLMALPTHRAHLEAFAQGDATPVLDALVPVVEALVAEARPQWQPMETAPKDGTWILACQPQWQVGVGWSRHDIVRWHGDFWRDSDGNDQDVTHWMPLPEPPDA